ncbi:MAG TPA: DUF5676 family membrane protein [Gemmatimonadales bacterium]|nr:DUF5676 family membrane protein [Gemmatimonadales bacterium]
MSLNPRAFGVAGGLTAAVLFVLCVAAVDVAPGSTTAFFGYLSTPISAPSTSPVR